MLSAVSCPLVAPSRRATDTTFLPRQVPDRAAISTDVPPAARGKTASRARTGRSAGRNLVRTSSPAVQRRELALALLAAVALALLMHWPLPLELGRDVPRDLGDPLPQAWQVAWDGNALLHQPLDWFQANAFWPLRDSLAFSDALVGYAPAGAIGSGPHAAIVRYDLLFLLAYALAFLGPYLLARELGAGRAGAMVAGAAFAYAPWRLEQDGHLHVLSSGGIALALALLVRGYRHGRPGLVLAGWLVAAWQVSPGFTLGIQLAYLLALLAARVRVWVRRGGGVGVAVGDRATATRGRGHGRRRPGAGGDGVRALAPVPGGRARPSGGQAERAHGRGLQRAAGAVPRGARREHALGPRHAWCPRRADVRARADAV